VTTLTHDQVAAALGATDDRLISDILATGATAEEFAQARSWLDNDEAPINAGAPLASGAVARIMELVEAADAEWQEQS